MPKSTNNKSHRLGSLSIAGGFPDGTEIEFVDGLNCLGGEMGISKATIENVST
jgi:hypothetical protein